MIVILFSHANDPLYIFMSWSSMYPSQVTYANTILLLSELEAHQFPLIQSCTFPKLVSSSEDIRKASIEAERRIDAHISICRFYFHFILSLEACWLAEIDRDVLSLMPSKENKKVKITIMQETGSAHQTKWYYTYRQQFVPEAKANKTVE